MLHGLRARALALFIAIGALVVAVPLAVGAEEHGDPASQRHHVEFTREAVGQVTTGSPVKGPNGEMIFPISGSSALAGDFVGTGFGAQWLTGNEQAQRGAGAGVTVWTLSDSPCGVGTLIVYVAAHGPIVTAPGVWRIAKGAGTGELANTSGGGVFAPSPGQPIQYIGDIRCS